MKPFATIKKLPRQRTLTEEVEAYRKPKRIARIATILSSKYRSLELTFTTSFTKHHLLSVETGNGLLRLLSVSVFVGENMPPRKKAPQVYMEAR